MAKYKVEMVVTGTVTVDVEAENAQDAKDVAFEAVDRLSFSGLSKIRTNIGCVEDDTHRDVTFQRTLDLHRPNKGRAPRYANYYGEEAF